MGAVAEEGGRTREERLFGALPLRPLARKGRGAPIGARPATPPVTRRSSTSALGPSPSSAPFLSSASLLFSLSLLICLVGAVGAKSDENSHGEGSAQRNRRITCYTCVNVSTNDECNRFAIDRPCPEGGDFCLTLHVMEGKDRDRSLLVNKRCASLEDCAGDYTGCTTAYGQTQCVSCCDQPYCNDSVPSNDTNAVFYRSVACSITADRRMYGVIWTVAAALIPTLKTLRSGALK